MTHRAFLPFLFLPSHAVAHMLGRQAERAAVLALRAILQDHRQLEVAPADPFRRAPLDVFLAHHGAWGAGGRLDIGDPRLEGRIILEDDLKNATRRVRGVAPTAAAVSGQKTTPPPSEGGGGVFTSQCCRAIPSGGGGAAPGAGRRRQSSRACRAANPRRT